MPDLTSEQRSLVILRDRERCLRCGGRPATIQHRRAKGMGGLGPRGPKLTCADALVLCAICNAGVEAQWQEEAITFGWKIPRSCPVPSTAIPYFDRMTHGWWLADPTGGRLPLSADDATAMMALAYP